MKPLLMPRRDPRRGLIVLHDLLCKALALSDGQLLFAQLLSSCLLPFGNSENTVVVPPLVLDFF